MQNTHQHVYAANLRQNLGYPLRNPRPGIGLGPPYTDGFQIGDVGCIDQYGEFIVFFNINFPPKDLGFDPPDNPRFDRPVPRQGCDRETVYVSGAKRRAGEARTNQGYKFLATSRSGAILILPDGATLFELEDKHLDNIQQLVMNHAVQWCSYTKRDRLYLLTAMYKTKAWTLGAFSDGFSDGEIYVDRQSDTDPYKWECSFTMDHQQAPQNNSIPNQTVFIKGFKITVNPDLLRVLERVQVERPRWSALLLAKLQLETRKWLSGPLAKIEYFPAPDSYQSSHPLVIINRLLLDKVRMPVKGDISSHPAESDARILHNRLTDLRSRYEAQSRKLAAVRKKLRIVALTAELERLKRSVSTRMDELVAVRDDLDKFPDVSHELLAARNDLRTYEAGFHQLHQQHNVQLRNITSVVAKDQPESPDIRHYVEDSDVCAEKAIIRTLESLNEVIQWTSKSISTYFLHHVQSPNNEEEPSAVQRASESIPPALVDRLRTVSHHNLSLHLSIAFQAYLTSHARSIISSWTMDKRTDELLSKAYEQLRKSETQTSAAGWRSLIHANIPACTSTSNNLVSHAIQGLSDIVVAAGCAASTSDTASKMSPKFWYNISSIILIAENLRELIGNTLVADFKVVAHPAQMFDEASMVLDPERGRGVPAGQARGKRVLCTTHLGLIKEVVQESPISWQRNTLSASVVVKPVVVLRDSR
ncbi:hypothetical protein JVU11DRAFT_1177 [Chiua virens]|nr:hypothetical protein JVU11DRAFT_1177 [Chiua virens]